MCFAIPEYHDGYGFVLRCFANLIDQFPRVMDGHVVVLQNQIACNQSSLTSGREMVMVTHAGAAPIAARSLKLTIRDL